MKPTVALVQQEGLFLALSGYKMNSDMGTMSALTIALALVLDLFFLPTLLIKLESEKNDEKIDLHLDDVPLPAPVPATTLGAGPDA